MKLSQFINESRRIDESRDMFKAGVYDTKLVEDYKNGIYHRGIRRDYASRLLWNYFADIQDACDYSEGSWTEDDFKRNFEGLHTDMFADPEYVTTSVGWINDEWLDETDEEYNQLIIDVYGDIFKADLTDKRGMQKVFDKACAAILDHIMDRFGDHIKLTKKVKTIQVK